MNGLDTNGREACELVRMSLTHLRALQDEPTQLSNFHAQPMMNYPTFQQLPVAIACRWNVPRVLEYPSAMLATTHGLNIAHAHFAPHPN